MSTTITIFIYSSLIALSVAIFTWLLLGPLTRIELEKQQSRKVRLPIFFKLLWPFIQLVRPLIWKVALRGFCENIEKKSSIKPA